MIGLGNELRGDDAVGLEVARRVPGAVVCEREPLRLLDLWGGRDGVVLVDAARGSGPPGTVTVLDASECPLPRPFFAQSTHHVALGDAVELARTVRALPRRVRVVAIEGADYTLGQPLSPAVEAALPAAVAAVGRCTSGA